MNALGEAVTLVADVSVQVTKPTNMTGPEIIARATMIQTIAIVLMLGRIQKSLNGIADELNQQGNK